MTTLSLTPFRLIALSAAPQMITLLGMLLLYYGPPIRCLRGGGRAPRRVRRGDGSCVRAPPALRRRVCHGILAGHGDRAPPREPPAAGPGGRDLSVAAVPRRALDANGSDEAHRCTWGLRRLTRGRGPGGWCGSARASSSRGSR